MKLTKQGVRDLDTARRKPERSEVPTNCEHRRLVECHIGCGHYVCLDCDFSWDREAES